MSVHIQCQTSIYTLSLCRGHSWRVRLAKQETLTLPGHLVSPLVCRGPWMSTVVLYCWCHSDVTSVLLYFTLEFLLKFDIALNMISIKIFLFWVLKWFWPVQHRLILNWLNILNNIQGPVKKFCHRRLTMHKRKVWFNYLIHTCISKELLYKHDKQIKLHTYCRSRLIIIVAYVHFCIIHLIVKKTETYQFYYYWHSK